MNDHLNDLSLAAPIAPEPTRPAMYGRRERLALIAGGLLMLTIVAASIFIAQRTSQDDADLARNLRVRRHTVAMMQAVLSAETGQRGYLLTGLDSYLEPFTKAQAHVPGMLEELRGELAGDRDWDRWRAVIEAKMAELSRTVELQQQGRHDQALAEVMTGRGKDDMTLAREIADRLGERQSAAVAADVARSEQGARSLVAVDAGALILMVLLALLIGRSLRGTMKALRASRRDLVIANKALQAGQDRLEIAVAARTSELTDANEEIQRFAYIVSHDLRAPLLNIIGFTAELQDATNRLNRFVAENLEPAGIAVPVDVREASQEDLPEAIRFIQTSTAKMDRLITAILRLSREGRRVLTPQHVDMAEMLSGIADSVRQLAADADAEITVREVPAIVSDRLAIEQVFSNLIENALKYLVPGRPGRVEVTGRAEAGWMRYDVSDNGRGIAARDLDRVFELFRRAGQQTTPGEGIGLAHARALLRRLGGTIVCESTLGVGSVFIVRLPPVLTHAKDTSE